MRYRASEKLEIIRLVEQSHLGVGSTLDKLGIPKTCPSYKFRPAQKSWCFGRSSDWLRWLRRRTSS